MLYNIIHNEVWQNEVDDLKADILYPINNLQVKPFFVILLSYFYCLYIVLAFHFVVFLNGKINIKIP